MAGRYLVDLLKKIRAATQHDQMNSGLEVVSQSSGRCPSRVKAKTLRAASTQVDEYG